MEGLVGGQGGVEEEEPVGEGVVEGVLLGVEDAFVGGAEAAEGHAEGVALVVGGVGGGSGSSCSTYSGSGAPSGRSTASCAQSWAWRQGEGPGRLNSTEGSR